MSSIKVEGLPELTRALERAGGKQFSEEIVKPALLRGAEEIRREAMAVAPVKTGALRRSLIAKLSDKPGLLRSFMAVDMSQINKRDTRGRRSRYPYIVERGAAAHKISASRGGFLHFGNVFSRSVSHPGFQGKYFFRRAVNAKRRSVPLQIITELGAALDARLSAGRISSL